MTIPHWLIVRLKNQYPMLHYLTERTFGVEIEFYGLEYTLTPVDGSIIKPYNIHSKARDGRNFSQLCQQAKINLGADKNSWHFEEDTSVRGRLRTPVRRRTNQSYTQRSRRFGAGLSSFLILK